MNADQKGFLVSLNHPNYSFLTCADCIQYEDLLGFTVIKAEKLNYASVIDAIQKGNFYATKFPEIKELYFEDEYIQIKCSEAREICLNTLTREGMRVAHTDGYVKDLMEVTDHRMAII